MDLLHCPYAVERSQTLILSLSRDLLRRKCRGKTKAASALKLYNDGTHHLKSADSNNNSSPLRCRSVWVQTSFFSDPSVPALWNITMLAECLPHSQRTCCFAPQGSLLFIAELDNLITVIIHNHSVETAILGTHFVYYNDIH